MGNDIILPSESVKNIGVLFDRTLSMPDQVSDVCKSCFYCLRNIGKIRRLLTFETAERLIHSFIAVKLDYWNSLFYGLPEYHIHRLQLSIQNAAAHLNTFTKKLDQCTLNLF